MAPRSVPRFAWWIAAAAAALACACLAAILRFGEPRPLRFGAYTDTRFGLSVSAPPGWTLLRVRRTPYIREFLIVPPDVKPADAHTSTYARLTLRRGAGAQSVRRVVDDAQAAIEREAEEYQVVEQSEAKLSGKPSYSVATASTSQSGTRWVRVTAVENRGMIAVWEQQVVPAAAARNLRRDMDRMLDDFRWR